MPGASPIDNRIIGWGHGRISLVPWIRWCRTDSKEIFHRACNVSIFRQKGQRSRSYRHTQARSQDFFLTRRRKLQPKGPRAGLEYLVRGLPAPLHQLWGLGSAVSSPAGSRWSPRPPNDFHAFSVSRSSSVLFITACFTRGTSAKA